MTAHSLGEWFRTRLEPCPELPRLVDYLDGVLVDGVADFEAHVADCPICRAVVNDWARGPEFDKVDGEQPNRRPMAPVLDLRHHRRPQHRYGKWLAGAVLLAAALTVWWLRPAPPSASGPDQPLTVKGAFALHLGVRRGDKAFRVEPDQLLETGDQLGFFYSSPIGGYLHLSLVQSDSRITHIWPSDGQLSQRVSAAGEARIDAGLRVSARDPGEPGCVCILATFGSTPLTFERLETIRRSLTDTDPCQRLPSMAVDGTSVHVLTVKR